MDRGGRPRRARWRTSRPPREGRSRERPPRSLTVFTHARPEQTGDALRRVIELAREAGDRGAPVPQDEVDKHGIEARDGVVARRRPGRRHRPRGRARRRRHDPVHAAPVRGPARCRSSRSTSARSASWPRSSPRSSTGACGWRWRASFDVLELPGLVAATYEGRRDRHERHLVPPAPHRARGRARLLGGGRAARRGALRRAGGGHAGRLDRLQPRQRRAGARVGGGGLRGVVHRAAHAHRAVARGRAGRRAVGHQPLARGGRRDDHGRPQVCVLPREEHDDDRFRPRCALLAQLPGASFYHRLRDKFGRLAATDAIAWPRGSRGDPQAGELGRSHGGENR